MSPNDGKPVVIVPGRRHGRPPGGRRAVDRRLRADGVNGKRMTVDVRGMVHIVTDEEFAKIKFAGGHQPAGR